MKYEKPVFLDPKLGEDGGAITPQGFIVLIAVLVAGVLIIAAGVAYSAVAAIEVAVATSVGAVKS